MMPPVPTELAASTPATSIAIAETFLIALANVPAVSLPWTSPAAVPATAMDADANPWSRPCFIELTTPGRMLLTTSCWLVASDS